MNIYREVDSDEPESEEDFGAYDGEGQIVLRPLTVIWEEGDKRGVRCWLVTENQPE